MPDIWVAQVKEAARPNLWATLLGSAVLAALIGLTSSYVTARLTISGNTEIAHMTAQSQLEQERMRAKLVLDQENARARITAYQTMSARLDDLDQAFLSYLIFVQWAADHGMDAATKHRVDEQLKEVGKKERLVTTAQADPLLAADPLRSDIDECLTKLVAVMSAARQQPSSALRQRALEKDLRRLRSEAAARASQVSIP